MNLLRILKQKLRNFYFKIVKAGYSEKDFDEYQKDYLYLPDCRDASLKEQFYSGNLEKINHPIIQYYKQLLRLIDEQVQGKKGFAIIRVSDGEAYFLQGRLVGNGPKRHFTSGQTLSLEYLNLFRQGLLKCDLRLIEMYKNNQQNFLKIYGRNIFSEIPFECVYALIASRDVFRRPYKIGLIGSEKKLEIIKQLLESKTYQQYIGRDKFDHYIAVPEKGASNDVLQLAKHIKAQLRGDIDVYLVGIGIAKLAVLPELKKSSHAVFIDAGAGLSALAGLVSHSRAYFADWTNFRLKNYDYSQVDIMDADMKEEKIVLV